MHNIYLSDADFHIPTLTERKEIRALQRRHNLKCWIKRFLISFVIIGIIIIFQIIARQGKSSIFMNYISVDSLLVYSGFIFIGINLLSCLQLLLKTKVLFNIKKTEIKKLIVKKKVVVDDIMKYSNIRIKYKYLTCQQEDGTFILNRIWVHGPIAFSCIKEGQTIYVKCIHKSGETHYYYVA